MICTALSSIRVSRAGLAALALAIAVAVRGGPGTANPELDRPAMSVTLDRAQAS